jgi:hypothetical protein
MIQNGYKALSSYSHTPKWDESFGKKIGNLKLTELEDFEYAIHMTNIAIYNLVHLYVFVYPMLLFPVDIVSRFGFNGPVGAFTDQFNYELLEYYLGKDLCLTVKNELVNIEHVQNLLEWFESQKILNEIEIRSTFNNERNKDIDPNMGLAQLYGHEKSRMRALILSMNYIGANQEQNDDINKKESSIIGDFFDGFYE